MTDDILTELKFCAGYHDRMGLHENARLFKGAAAEIERLRADLATYRARVDAYDDQVARLREQLRNHEQALAEEPEAINLWRFWSRQARKHADKNKHLRAERDELLEALRLIATGRNGAISSRWMSGGQFDRGRNLGYDEQAWRARDAIAKAEGEQT